MASKRRLLLLAGAAAVLVAVRASAQTPPPLGAAASFAAFGGSDVTNSGPTRVTGNVGASPGATVSGFPPGTIDTGALIADNGTLNQAQRDSAAAYAQLAAQPCTPLTSAHPVANRVYCVSELGASLTLEGTASDFWIFRIPASLTTRDAFSVQLLGGTTSSNVFWQVDGALTIGANSAFVGTILARTDIHLLHAAALSGRALAPNGLVTLDTNDVAFCCVTPLAFAPAVLPPQKVGEPYAQTITVSGGTPPYTITLFAGTLPPGLQLAPNGTLSGTPTANGCFVFTVRAVDAHGCSSVHTYTFCDTITLSLEPKDDPKACVVYARDIVVTGGCAPYSFHATGLPPGLELMPKPDGKTIAGTPTAEAPGDYNVTIDVTDAAGCTASATFPLHVTCGLVLPLLDLPAGMVGVPYHATIAPLCGLAPFRFSTSIISPAPPNDDLPPGVFPPTSDGDIDGTPTAPGVYVFPVTVTDARNCTDTRTYSITVCATPHTDITLPKGKVCAAYDYGPIAGTLLDPASLPPDLKVIDGRLTGVPKKSDMFRFTMQLASPAACGADVQSYIVKIDCPLLQLPDLPPPIAGVPVTQSLAPSFCLPFQWKVSGKLPDGQTVDNADFSGILQVTPQPGDYDFTVSSVNSECPASRRYTGNVPPPPCANYLPLSPPSVPAGTIGLFYSQVFSTSAPVTFTLLPPNAQPPGLAFVQNGPTSATLSGFPTTAGRFNFVIVANSGQCTTSQTYSMTVGPATIPPVDIPALSPWVLLLVAMAMAFMAARRIS
jgi:hypothetical protein